MTERHTRHLWFSLLILGWIGLHPVGAQEAPPDTLAAGAPPESSAVALSADEALAAHLREVLANIGEFQEVRATVNAGVVHLSGTVVQAADREAVAELASRFEGVLYVDNDIEAEAGVETRVGPTVAKVRRYVDNVRAYLPVAGVAFLVVFVFWLLSRLIGQWQAPRRLHISPLVWGLIRRLIRAALFLVGLLLAFDILGITALVGALLGTVGVVGLAIGFAFQDIVENYLAGLLLSLRQPFDVNDLVRIGEYEGRVIRLTSRELVLLTFEGNHARLPNAMVFKSALLNFTRNPRRLFHFDVGVGADQDLVTAMQVGVGTLEAMKGVLADPPPFARVNLLADSNVTVRFHGWVDQHEADFEKVKSEAIRLVKVALDEAGVEMPEPIYRVQLRRFAEPSLEAKAGPSAKQQAEAIDVTPDGKLDAQVQEDLASSEEQNLLSE